VANREWLAVAVLGTPTIGVLLMALVPERTLARVATTTAIVTASVSVALATLALADPGTRLLGRWIVVDAAGGVLVGVIGVIGLASTLVSPQVLGHGHGSLFRPHRAERVYWVVLFAFWTVLLAVPLAGNLGAAWLVIEATTAASALLVGFSGRARALEAGWKYLILTSLGLGVALLGIVMLAAAGSGGGLDTLAWRSLPTATLDPDLTLVAYVLLLAGLAAKIGWAPVHNWLPDAHSEAPAPVSALLSAALLPAVLLVAWRSQQALAPTIGTGTAGDVLIAFGIVSLTVAVPFLWRPQAWKRLLAYSSLEHMGVIALGIGFGGPLALAGVAVHIVGHAVAKALGFYAAIPLLGHDPRAVGHAVGGIARTRPALGVSLGVSLGALAGVPPSPLFVSEVLIVAGGFQTGHPVPAGVAAALLALGFLGLAHALIETVAGKPRHRDPAIAPGLRGVIALTTVSVTALLLLAGVALWLPGSAIVDGLLRGLA
jgi:hydrogenase-4 component F